MTLTLQQIEEVADALSNFDFQTLSNLAAPLLNVPVANIAGQGTLKEQARKFVEHMNNWRPPRDRELLQMLAQHPSAALQGLANRLLTPTFFSPTGLARDAILLGKQAFVDRGDLRTVLKDFIHPSLYTTHVLVVRGEQPGGKSYSWCFLRHLARESGATPKLLKLQDCHTPRELFESVRLRLDLDFSELPKMRDEPQLSRIEPLVAWFAGKFDAIKKPYWLVIDGMNEPSTTKPMQDAAYAIARAVEEERPDKLWVALLGYNDPIVDPELKYIAQDDAKFPDADQVAQDLELIAKASKIETPSPGRAREWANKLFAQYARLDKESMEKIKETIEKYSALLLEGEKP